MCGIAGFLGGGGRADCAAVARSMAEAMHHRGPDDSGVWVDEGARIALAHRRLAILDLSPAGHQPMASTDGRHVIVFNGEIYNHQALRALLAGENWRGHSDTETLLAAITAWGVETTLRLCVGMFAFALWDRQERSLTLARDRLGEKPLYYGTMAGHFLFASELKALRTWPGFSGEIDRDALALFMRRNYVPAPWSIYRGIRKLPPGMFLRVAAQGPSTVVAEPIPYWSAREAAESGLAQPFAGDVGEAADELERLLRQAIAGQMLADVPLGAFLSGGIDSSVVVALMQAQSSRPVRSFSIGFHEGEYNEAHHAKAVAAHLGCDHTELYATPRQAMNVIPRLPALYDEPFADSSQIPTFLVSQLARQHVTVSLSGDGGDELFGGYNRYFWAMQLWRRFSRMPRPLRRAAQAGLTALSPAAWNRLFHMAGPLLPAALRHANPGDKLHKLAALFAARQPEAIYQRLVSHWDDPAAVVWHSHEPATALFDPARWLDSPDFPQRMMYLDQVSYLPDDILVKVDRAAMAVSLETRVPLLDHRLVEFAWRLPLAMKIRDGQGKWLLRQVLYRHVPRHLIDRPKMGFGVPIDVWLRGPMKDWAEALLDEARLRRESYFDPTPIRHLWAEHQSGRRNWAYHLWDVLMFQAWREANP